MNRYSRLARRAVAPSIVLGLLVLAAPAPAQKVNLGRRSRPTPPPPSQGNNANVPEEYKDTPPVLRFKMRDIDGNEVDLKDYKGNVILMVNVASKCGYTPQYKELESLYEKYKDQGFVILGFPSNDFGEQEPGDAAEIKKFCTEKYNVSFKLFDKVPVKTMESACDLYKFLIDRRTNAQYGGDIQWNFTKFLIDRKGEIRGRFKSDVSPDHPRVVKRIESLLKVKGPKPKPSESDADKAAADKGDSDKADGDDAEKPKSEGGDMSGDGK